MSDPIAIGIIDLLKRGALTLTQLFVWITILLTIVNGSRRSRGCNNTFRVPLKLRLVIISRGRGPGKCVMKLISVPTIASIVVQCIGSEVGSVSMHVLAPGLRLSRTSVRR